MNKFFSIFFILKFETNFVPKKIQRESSKEKKDFLSTNLKFQTKSIWEFLECVSLERLKWKV